MKKATIIRQNNDSTVVKCPDCKRSITLKHEQVDEPNDGFGMLHIGEQNLSYVVCMNKPAGEYCEFAGDMKLTDSFEYKNF